MPLFTQLLAVQSFISVEKWTEGKVESLTELPADWLNRWIQSQMLLKYNILDATRILKVYSLILASSFYVIIK